MARPIGFLFIFFFLSFSFPAFESRRQMKQNMLFLYDERVNYMAFCHVIQLITFHWCVFTSLKELDYKKLTKPVKDFPSIILYFALASCAVLMGKKVDKILTTAMWRHFIRIILHNFLLLCWTSQSGYEQNVGI